MFEPTHEITLVFDDGTCADVEVRVVRGAAFTREEWNARRDPSWRLVDGAWTWCGAVPAGCESVTLQSLAQAAFRRLTWELVDGRVKLEGSRLVLARDSHDHASLWLEIRDGVLQVADDHHACPLTDTTTALQLRALVSEWKASGVIAASERG